VATQRLGAAMLAGLLYAQCLLGLIAVSLVTGKNAGWADAAEGYGVRPQALIMAMTGQGSRSGIARRE
jgi:hypothetical protein